MMVLSRKNRKKKDEFDYDEEERVKKVLEYRKNWKPKHPDEDFVKIALNEINKDANAYFFDELGDRQKH